MQRRGLWEDWKNIAKNMDDAWCILYDFTVVGTKVQFHEV